VTQTFDYKDDKTILVTTLMHTSGQWIDSSLPLPITKPGCQEIGSSTTYCRRYALAAMIGISQYDDDGESAMSREKQSKPIEQPSKEMLMHKIEVASEVRINKYLEHIVMKSGKSPHDLIRYALSTPDKTGEFKKGLAEFEKGQMIVQSGSLGS
jgi:hypothetical protein